MGRQRRVGTALAGLIGALLPLVPLAPARALDEIVVQLPLLDTGFTLKVSELRSREALRNGNSDLAELDRATNGQVGRELWQVLNEPVPLTLTHIVDGSVGSPLVEQAMLVLSSMGHVEGKAPDLTGERLREALDRASAKGKPTLLDLIEALPGQRLTIDLTRAKTIATRMVDQRDEAEHLLTSLPPAPPPPAPISAGAVTVRTVQVTVAHRKQPLQLVVVEPQGPGNGRLVLISHGLWDDPKSFIGWARLLASRGYTVILPRHPGSDNSQQQAVLEGKAPPPKPQELALRPLDLKAAIDQAGSLGLRSKVDTQRVVLLGHSWGGTTVLQMAGVRPMERNLLKRCGDLKDSNRNLSWTLQCSWLQGVNLAAGIQDPRVIAVGAVSPPASLLFPHGAATQMTGRALVVSGSRDWVVPPDPEALDPMRWGRTHGHQLVLVNGGDHFNLRPEDRADGGVLGPLLLAWTDAAFAAGDAVRPRAGAAPILVGGAWGNAEMPMVDATRGL